MSAPGPTTMAAMRVPLWLKIGWTVWVIAWVPFYFLADVAHPPVARQLARLRKYILLFNVFRPWRVSIEHTDEALSYSWDSHLRRNQNIFRFYLAPVEVLVDVRVGVHASPVQSNS